MTGQSTLLCAIATAGVSAAPEKQTAELRQARGNERLRVVVHFVSEFDGRQRVGLHGLILRWTQLALRVIAGTATGREQERKTGHATHDDDEERRQQNEKTERTNHAPGSCRAGALLSRLERARAEPRLSLSLQKMLRDGRSLALQEFSHRGLQRAILEGMRAERKGGFEPA